MNIATMRSSSMLELRSPPPFKIRVDWLALWEAAVFELIIILLRFLLLSYLFPTSPSRGILSAWKDQFTKLTHSHRHDRGPRW